MCRPCNAKCKCMAMCNNLHNNGGTCPKNVWRVRKRLMKAVLRKGRTTISTLTQTLLMKTNNDLLHFSA